MVKTYLKTVRRMFKKHLIRLLSLIGIVLISIGFISGIGSPTDMIKDGIENYYKKQNEVIRMWSTTPEYQALLSNLQRDIASKKITAEEAQQRLEKEFDSPYQMNQFLIKCRYSKRIKCIGKVKVWG